MFKPFGGPNSWPKKITKARKAELERTVKVLFELANDNSLDAQDRFTNRTDAKQLSDYLKTVKVEG